jgi:hypothetical protein
MINEKELRESNNLIKETVFNNLQEDCAGTSEDGEDGDDAIEIKNIKKLRALKKSTDDNLSEMLDLIKLQFGDVKTAALLQKSIGMLEDKKKTVLFDKLQLQIDSKDPRLDKSELVMFIMHEIGIVNQNYNGYYIITHGAFADDGANSKDHLFERIENIIKRSEPSRLQIVVKIGVHFTVLDIDKDHSSCLILDAAGDRCDLSARLCDKRQLIL